MKYTILLPFLALLAACEDPATPSTPAPPAQPDTSVELVECNRADLGPNEHCK